jgi:hypothetical protein
MTEPTTIRRRWLRYSMRTMLLLVTVLCVLLALVIVPAQRQRRAVEKIRGLGSWSRVVYDYESEGPYGGSVELRGPAWLRRWIGVDYFQDVVRVQVFLSRGDELTPDDLASLPGLRSLDVHDMPITDDGLLTLARLRKLEGLSLQSNEITDRGLEQLSSLTELQRLGVTSDQVTGEGLRPLAGRVNLQWLSLRSDGLSPGGLEVVAQLTSIQGLDLYSDNLTDECLKPLAGMKGLGGLTITGRSEMTDAPPGVTDLGLTYIAQLTNLGRLRISSPQITDAGLAHLTVLRKLKGLNIVHHQSVYTRAGVNHLKEQLPDTIVTDSAW